MVVNGLIDTGAILATIDHNDLWHGRCAAVVRESNRPWMTSEAVLTELFHMVGHARHEMEGAWAFVRSGLIVVATISQSELPELHELMSKYWDRPMDFADATLVHLARREGLNTILTIDRADFETYRIEGKRKFRILPNGSR